MRQLSLAGRYETVLLNIEGIVLFGNLKPVVSAGCSMVPFAKVSGRKTGPRRLKSAGSVKCLD